MVRAEPGKVSQSHQGHNERLNEKYAQPMATVDDCQGPGLQGITKINGLGCEDKTKPDQERREQGLSRREAVVWRCV